MVARRTGFEAELNIKFDLDLAEIRTGSRRVEGKTKRTGRRNRNEGRMRRESTGICKDTSVEKRRTAKKNLRIKTMNINSYLI